jgi:hypothetical protein
LGLTSNDLGHILGISQALASRLTRGTFLLKEGSKPWEMALLLIRLYSGLIALVGNDGTLAMQWLHSPNIAFNNARPYDHIQTAIGLVFTCDYVDAHRVTTPALDLDRKGKKSQMD